MLRFVQILPHVSPEGDFLLRDLPGSGKRIDVLCRDLEACFDWGPVTWSTSHLEVIAIIGNRRILTFHYPKSKLPTGEFEWADLIRASLQGHPPDFIDVSDGSLEDLIKMLLDTTSTSLWVLDEEGINLSETLIHPNSQNSFMLGDHRGFDSQTEKVISQYNIPTISLGGKSYLSSHCLAAIISELERMVS